MILYILCWDFVFFSLVSSVLIFCYTFMMAAFKSLAGNSNIFYFGVVSLPPFLFPWPLQSIFDWNMDILGRYKHCYLSIFCYSTHTSSDADGKAPLNHCQVWLELRFLDWCRTPGGGECLLVTALQGSAGVSSIILFHFYLEHPGWEGSRGLISPHMASTKTNFKFQLPAWPSLYHPNRNLEVPPVQPREARSLRSQVGLCW